MVEIEKTTDSFTLRVSVARSEERIHITVRLQNELDESVTFNTATPKWCDIYLYDEEKNPCLERPMVAAVSKRQSIAAGE